MSRIDRTKPLHAPYTMYKEDREIYHQPKAWSDNARAFYEAAIYIGEVKETITIEGTNYDIPKFYDPMMLLIGLTVELSFKARILERYPNTLVRKRTYEKFATHKLKNHARRAGVELTKAEQEILIPLTAIIEWDSKYPAGRLGRCCELYPREHGEPVWMSPGTLLEDEQTTCLNLAKRLVDSNPK